MINRRKIVAIILLVLVLALAGISAFIAYRISTEVAVAPTAPASQPRATVSCTGQGGECRAGTACGTGQTLIAGADCAGGEVCCSATWISSASCTMTFSVSTAVCTPRPACLDEATPCTPTTPEGGYCPALTCPSGKTVYKNLADNAVGVYNTDAANQIAEGGTVNPGQTLVYAVPYTIDPGVDHAVVEDVLNDKLTFVDSTSECTLQAATNKVVCNLTKEAVAAGRKPMIRVKVKDDAVAGPLFNAASIASSYITSTNTVSTDVSRSICDSTLNIAVAETVAIACKSKSAMNNAGTVIISQVGKNETFMYSLELTNSGNTAAPNVVATDVLGTKLVFVDSDSGCTFAEASRTVTCNASLNANETKKVTFRVKTIADLTDGEVISNTASAKLATSPAAETGSECTKALTVSIPVLTAAKEAYKDNTNNTAGNYQFTDAITTVSKNQVFTYAIQISNSGTGTASGVVVTDPLTGQNQDQLTFIDKDSRCEWTAATKLIRCTVDVQPASITTVGFRVSVGSGAVNGAVIANAGVVSYQNVDINVTKNLTVSSIVGCDNTCTSAAECTTGFSCDTASGKCRNISCTTESSCVCPVAATAAPTQAPVVIVVTAAPTQVAAVATAAPTEAAVLPETGIFDIPGAAIFGGGLLLAIVGILLAL